MSSSPPPQGRPDAGSGVCPFEVGDPESIGGWRLLGRLGAGGMGVVYLGQNASGAKAAIKVINPGRAHNPEFRARFDTEVANARRVASFYTAQVLGDGDTDGFAYLVTEYIDGPSLTDYIAAHGGLQPVGLRSLAAGVAAALVAIHAVNLVHRDLKPGNVLLTADGPRVIDFGIARALDSHHHHTATGFLIGSAGYMAPELAFGGQVSTAADIFAWGTLVAYAATGRNPFGTGTPIELAARAKQANYDLSGVPLDLVPLLRTALDPDPARRPTAETLLAQLVGAQVPAEATTGFVPPGWFGGSLLPPSAQAPLPGIASPDLSAAGPPDRPSEAVSEPGMPGSAKPRILCHGSSNLGGALAGLALLVLTAGLVLTPPGSTGQHLVYWLVLWVCVVAIVVSLWLGFGGGRKRLPIFGALTTLVVAALAASGCYVLLKTHGDVKVRLTVVSDGKDQNDRKLNVVVHAPSSAHRSHLRFYVTPQPASKKSSCGYGAAVDLTPIVDGHKRDVVHLRGGTTYPVDIDIGGTWQQVKFVAQVVGSACQEVDLSFKSGVLHDDLWWLP